MKWIEFHFLFDSWLRTIYHFLILRDAPWIIFLLGLIIRRESLRLLFHSSLINAVYSDVWTLIILLRRTGSDTSTTTESVDVERAFWIILLTWFDSADVIEGVDVEHAFWTTRRTWFDAAATEGVDVFRALEVLLETMVDTSLACEKWLSCGVQPSRIDQTTIVGTNSFTFVSPIVISEVLCIHIHLVIHTRS